MKIIKVKEINDCVGETAVKEFYFDEKIDMKFINYLSQYGEFRYFAEFPKPYYQIYIPDVAFIKGIKNNYYIQVVLAEENEKTAENSILNIVNNYKHKKAV